CSPAPEPISSFLPLTYANRINPPPPMSLTNRRSFLRAASLLSLGGFALPGGAWAAAPTGGRKHRKILFFSKSSGFEHSAISYKTGKPSAAEAVLLELGPKNNWEFTFSKDGSLFSKEYLAQFDGY